MRSEVLDETATRQALPAASASTAVAAPSPSPSAEAAPTAVAATAEAELAREALRGFKPCGLPRRDGVIR